MRKNAILTLTIIVSILFLPIFTGCSKEKKGTIVFTANGENFVRLGFIDKSGWKISFSNLFVNISNPVAYNKTEKLKAKLKGEYFIDLAEGDENANPIITGKITGIKAGNYQSLKFSIKRARDGKYKGYTIVMTGKAEKNGKIIPFTIKLDEEMEFDGREGYVGDELKGILEENASTDVEMTFHFDHIFGDIEAEKNDHINTGSVGFDFFYQFTENAKIDISQKEMEDKEGYNTLIKAIWTLGHLGEGHCIVSRQSTKL